MIEPQRAQEVIRDERPRHWRVETTLHAEFKVENVRFVHDPKWRESFFSIQGIRDINQGIYEEITPRVVFWLTIRALYLMSGFLWFGGAAIIVLAYSERAFARFLVIGTAAVILAASYLPQIEERLYWWRFERARRQAEAHRRTG